MSDPVNLAVLRQAVDLLQRRRESLVVLRQIRVGDEVEPLVDAGRALLEGEREWRCEAGYAKYTCDLARKSERHREAHPNCGWVVVIPVSEEK